MCLGSPLARVEGDIAFTTLLKWMPNLRINIHEENGSFHFHPRGLIHSLLLFCIFPNQKAQTTD
ncbi:hypothetical protein [Cytobacillus purgationiresistens]|uniref:hypothetical protein n=1 Tax=Cytobacillus purgationiresistens TaxID=863449 RepID=UPI0035203A1A